MPRAKDLLNKSQQEQIVNAIRQAEEGTLGEIRLHLEDSTRQEPLPRAQEVFRMLKMEKTKGRTGVLIYSAVKDRKLAIIGDEGIHAVTGNDFWESERDLLIDYFSKENYAEGLVRVIGLIGEQLKQFFPAKRENANELPDDISVK